MDTSQEMKHLNDEWPALGSVVKRSKRCSKRFAHLVINQNELPIEMTNTTGTHLQHINDDCLIDIFSVKSLTLLDLCSLAETCTRFKQIAERVFPKEFQISFVDYYQVELGNSGLNECAEHDIERIFKNFGSILSAVSISGWSRCVRTQQERSEIMLNLVATYCVDTLESLSIHDVKITDVLSVKLKPIFKRLQLLNIDTGSIEADTTLFADLNSLIELRVSFVQNDSAVLENVFPKLERFTYDGRQINQSFSTFISRHPSLKTLDSWAVLDETNSADILQLIGNSCKDLEKLGVITHASSLLPLQASKSVKILELQHTSCQDLSFVPAMTKLRELKFDDCIRPKDSNQFAFLNQLTKLHINLHYTSGSVDAVDIIRRLINLEELTVSTPYSRYGFVLDEETFAKIVSIVKGRPNVLRLQCNFDFVYNSKKCDENQKVRLIELYDE